MSWRSIPCKVQELRLDITLLCGQSFRWKETAPGQFSSVLAGKVWTLQQSEDTLYYTVHGDGLPQHCKDISFSQPSTECSSDHSTSQAAAVQTDAKRKSRLQIKVKQESTIKTEKECENIKGNEKAPKSPCFKPISHCKVESEGVDSGPCATVLVDYFQLGVSLVGLYRAWSDRDANFRDKAGTFTGVRMLRQDPVENLFSFICSSNNNISRIGSMVEKLCEHFGDVAGVVGDRTYHSFPTIEALAGKNVEPALRHLGFGYRAKYICQTAQYLKSSRGKDWLFGLRQVPYQQAKEELMKLSGVGAKVADCVCLMSLDKAGAIPVDTHVWQIAQRDYLPKLRNNKTLTNSIYKEIGDHFRDLWGEYAGWAHSVLFSADLKKFKDLKSKEMALQMPSEELLDLRESWCDTHYDVRESEILYFLKSYTHEIHLGSEFIIKGKKRAKSTKANPSKKVKF